MTKPATPHTIIGDSGPLIALSLIGQLDLLQQLYTRVIIPQAVWDEVTIQGFGMAGALEISQLTWLDIQAPLPHVLQPLSVLVDRGEAQALALAMQYHGSIVLLDDAQARRVAERLQIERIGTLGILRKAKKAGLIFAIKPLILKLKYSGIFISQPLIDAILKDVGE